MVTRNEELQINQSSYCKQEFRIKNRVGFEKIQEKLLFRVQSSPRSRCRKE